MMSLSSSPSRVATVPLQIVHLEDNDGDAETVERELREAGMAAEIARVRNEAGFRHELARPEINVILANCHSPELEGFSAVELAREERPEVPFIFVSSQLDHHHAIESLSAGVTDFVFKQHLRELIPVIRRAVGESQTRDELLIARKNLRAQAELLDHANDSIILCDADGTIRYWNRGSERIYGWTKEEAVGQKVHTLLKTQLASETADLEATLRAQSHWEGELEQTTRDGRRVQIASHWTLKGKTPDSSRLQINTDITAQKNAESALRQSEERYRRFVDEDLTGNLVMRPDGSILTCNQAFLRSFGFESVEGAKSMNVMSLMRHRKDGAELFALVQKEGVAERHELEMRQAGGDAVYVAARLVGEFDGDGNLAEVRGYLFNDTRRKRLEEELIQAQKMEGLGTLAGGIAHDFNNILTIILGYARQLESRPARPEQIAGTVDVIKEAVERGATLVQQLLTSARQAEVRFASLDLNALLRDLEQMLWATFPRMIDFKLSLQPNLPLITADRSQIHQVLLNLCVNARDAMPNGGSISLETSLHSSEHVAEFFTGAELKQYVCIRVRDTGMGMTPEVKAHIFEPFFTTKERAKGTGLGLSVVYGVVNKHRGFIQAESEPNVGTTFSIYLPVGQEQEQLGGVAAPDTQRKGHEPQTILLVEDEEMLRDLGVEILQAEGYRVLAAKDGIEAVEMFADHHEHIGLVVCDLGLPRLGGREVFLKMKELRPDVRAIVASGYLEPNMRSEILKAGVLDTIQKPYDFRDLVEKIGSIIGAAQSEDDQPQLF